MYSFAPDRQPRRAPDDMQADGFRRAFRREPDADATAASPTATQPRDVAIPQADGEP